MNNTNRAKLKVARQILKFTPSTCGLGLIIRLRAFAIIRGRDDEGAVDEVLAEAARLVSMRSRRN
jgi:hypothetical protein